ncbi:(deoxy)nucleoside triphosphate pyrophosphohydrolase [Singulisphaera sp. PoT]|uniref:(deoxy)nucleoside triphosphate pyrophosphohydrolase n=1 Tax=Singulisphaera sp. PoT TaxID=3411797 RepID=UPI003BF5434C
MPETNTFEQERPVRVGIALVARDGRFLVRQRPPGAAMPGVWEFPGGKCEPEESAEDATRRECLEEIGIEVELLGLRRRFDHRYPHAWVELSFFDAKTVEPDAEPPSETGFIWVSAAMLSSLVFPGANEAILEDLAREHQQR